MRTLLLALLAVAGPAFAGPVPPSGCPTCIQNTASPQDAQINIGTGTIRGTLTVSTLTAAHFVVTNLTATQFTGGGAGLTGLNASQLASGTVPTARVAGAYLGITAVGTITAGTWQGANVGTQFGGSGQNWSTVNQGAIPYFSGTGAMTTLAAGTVNYLLQAGGAGANPSWTNTPTILGTNVTAIPLANLQTGNLPSAIKATDASLVTVSGSKVSGNISGNAANITGTLAIGQLGAGTLASNVVAQTLVPSGVTAGTKGGPALSAQITVNSQGIVTGLTQYPIGGVSTFTAFVNVDNNWTHAQTFLSNVTINSVLNAQAVIDIVTNGGVGTPSFLEFVNPGLASYTIGDVDASTLRLNNNSHGPVVAYSSVTASAFFGDGSHLTGVPSTASISGFYVPYTGATGDVALGARTLSAGAIRADQQLDASGSSGWILNSSGGAIYAGAANIGSISTLGLALTGPVFTVGGSTLVVTGGKVGIGTATPGNDLEVGVLGSQHVFALNGGNQWKFEALANGNLLLENASVPWAGSGMEFTNTGGVSFGNQAVSLGLNQKLNFDGGTGNIFARGTSGNTQNGFQVQGDANGPATFGNGGLALGSYGSGGTAIPSNGLIVSGAVGAGVTVPLDPLHVSGTAHVPTVTSIGMNGVAVFSVPAGYANIAFGSYIGSPNYAGWMQTNNGSVAQDLFINPLHLAGTGGAVGINVAAMATNAGFQIEASSFVILQNGNIGVGATAPGKMLTVGNGVTNYGVDPTIRIDARAADQSILEFAKAGVTKWLLYSPTSSNDLNLFDSTDRVSFKSGGNVTLNTSGATLSVDKIAGANGAVSLLDSASVTAITLGSGSLVIGQNQQPVFIGANATPSNASVVIRSTSTTATNAALSIQNQSGTEIMRVQQNGNLGIGQSAPSFALDIGSGGATPSAQMRLNDNTDNQFVEFDNGSTKRFTIGQASAGLVFSGFNSVGRFFRFIPSGTLTNGDSTGNSGFYFQTQFNDSGNVYRGFTANITNSASATNSAIAEFQLAGVSKVHIDVSGKVGIGNTTPTTALSVYGVITSSTTQGTVACNAGTAVLSATATDQHGTFAAGALATACTYTFGTAWPKTPDCTAGTNAATPIAVSVTSPSTTSITITAAAALTGDNVSFVCQGAP